MGQGPTIGLEDLETLAPRLVRSIRSRVSAEAPAGPAEASPATEATAAVEAGEPTEEGSGNGWEGVQPELLAKRILQGDLDGLEHVHAAVKRALQFISANYQEEITLGELANAAHVSPSHLCYLFKNTLGVTFKTMLGMTRVEKAKQLLVAEPGHRITDISLDVGFGDLSHFEKTFKRLVKVNPREFRRREARESRAR